MEGETLKKYFYDNEAIDSYSDRLSTYGIDDSLADDDYLHILPNGNRSMEYDKAQQQFDGINSLDTFEYEMVKNGYGSLSHTSWKFPDKSKYEQAEKVFFDNDAIEVYSDQLNDYENKENFCSDFQIYKGRKLTRKSPFYPYGSAKPSIINTNSVYLIQNQNVQVPPQIYEVKSEPRKFHIPKRRDYGKTKTMRKQIHIRTNSIPNDKLYYSRGNYRCNSPQIGIYNARAMIYEDKKYLPRKTYSDDSLDILHNEKAFKRSQSLLGKPNRLGDVLLGRETEPINLKKNSVNATPMGKHEEDLQDMKENIHFRNNNTNLSPFNKPPYIKNENINSVTSNNVSRNQIIWDKIVNAPYITNDSINQTYANNSNENQLYGNTENLDHPYLRNPEGKRLQETHTTKNNLIKMNSREIPQQLNHTFENINEEDNKSFTNECSLINNTASNKPRSFNLPNPKQVQTAESNTNSKAYQREFLLPRPASENSRTVAEKGYQDNQFVSFDSNSIHSSQEYFKELDQSNSSNEDYMLKNRCTLSYEQSRNWNPQNAYERNFYEKKTSIKEHRLPDEDSQNGSNTNNGYSDNFEIFNITEETGPIDSTNTTVCRTGNGMQNEDKNKLLENETDHKERNKNDNISNNGSLGNTSAEDMPTEVNNFNQNHTKIISEELIVPKDILQLNDANYNKKSDKNEYPIYVSRRNEELNDIGKVSTYFNEKNKHNKVDEVTEEKSIEINPKTENHNISNDFHDKEHEKAHDNIQSNKRKSTINNRSDGNSKDYTDHGNLSNISSRNSSRNSHAGTFKRKITESYSKQIYEKNDDKSQVGSHKEKIENKKNHNNNDSFGSKFDEKSQIFSDASRGSHASSGFQVEEGYQRSFDESHDNNADENQTENTTNQKFSTKFEMMLNNKNEVKKVKSNSSSRRSSSNSNKSSKSRQNGEQKGNRNYGSVPILSGSHRSQSDNSPSASQDVIASSEKFNNYIQVSYLENQEDKDLKAVSLEKINNQTVGGDGLIKTDPVNSGMSVKEGNSSHRDRKTPPKKPKRSVSRMQTSDEIDDPVYAQISRSLQKDLSGLSQECPWGRKKSCGNKETWKEAWNRVRNKTIKIVPAYTQVEVSPTTEFCLEELKNCQPVFVNRSYELLDDDDVNTESKTMCGVYTAILCKKCNRFVQEECKEGCEMYKEQDEKYVKKEGTAKDKQNLK